MELQIVITRKVKRKIQKDPIGYYIRKKYRKKK